VAAVSGRWNPHGTCRGATPCISNVRQQALNPGEWPSCQVTRVYRFAQPHPLIKSGQSGQKFSSYGVKTACSTWSWVCTAHKPSLQMQLVQAQRSPSYGQSRGQSGARGYEGDSDFSSSPMALGRSSSMRSSFSRQGPTPAEEVAALKASLAEMEMRNGWVRVGRRCWSACTACEAPQQYLMAMG
jgi:hypothetical protein